MARRVVVVLLGFGLLAALAPTLAGASGPPVPEPNFAGSVKATPCTPETDDFTPGYNADAWYPGDCQRLHFTYGPLHIRPGQNDVLVSPITIEKPAYDGYVVRFRPNLVESDGTVPPIEKLHLHHAVWLTIPGTYGFSQPIGTEPTLDPRNYGNGPFFASGEEKTIFDAPRGYGMPVSGTDNWQLLYMVHNQKPQPDNVWITYDVDYVKARTPGAALIRPTYPVWLDVQAGHPYPVFNVERNYPTVGSATCTWPDQQCASAGPFGPGRDPTVGQGAPGNTGTNGPWAYTFPAKDASFGRIAKWQGGTLVGLGGHLHPGGLSDNIDLIRGGQTSRIFTSEAKYWDRIIRDKTGGPADSWDLSMTVTGLPRWAVHIKPGDTLRISATYDTSLQSTYEDMGIAVGMLAPDDASGLDPFTAPHDTSDTCVSGGLAAIPPTPPTLCEKGYVTHGHMAEASNYGGPDGAPLPTNIGPTVGSISIAGFNYLPGNQGIEGVAGVPAVSKSAGGVTFYNADAAIDVYHSITACQNPCNGPAGIAYPLSNASIGGMPRNFDSTQLGFGPPTLGGASNRGWWTLSVADMPTGTMLTYFCRIHPFMRGELAVVP
jgi:hypothetical protein